MTAPPHKVVVTDANVLINLIHVGRLGMCSHLPCHEFIVPDHVRAEITDPGQRKDLDEAIENGVFCVEAITDLDALSLFAALSVHLGRVEAACLALAAHNGWMIASDEKQRFRREAVNRIGEERIIGTADLFVMAINVGLLTIEDADQDKVLLEGRLFRMPFESFQEVIPSEE